MTSRVPASNWTEPGVVLRLLDRVAQTGGPMRLYAPRRGPESSGLLVYGQRENPELLEHLLGGLVAEVPGAGPRQVVLADDGVRFLLRNLRPEQRAALVRRASPLYQPALLRAWQASAATAEQVLIQATAKELYGDFLAGSSADAEQFDRIRAEELVLSWMRESDPDVRRGLARAMTSLGLRQVGETGDAVTFDARRHTCEESLFPGDPARIITPGWALATPEGDTVLAKATVQFDEDSP